MHSRHALTDKPPSKTVPTLLITGDLADQNWRVLEITAAAVPALNPQPYF